MSSQKVIGIFSQGIIDSLYCYTPDGLTACGFYREDIPPVPRSIYFKGKIVEQELVDGNTRVALASDNDVILYDKKKKKWYRHLKTPFLIEDIQICKGELSGNLLLSDGARQYLVALDTPTITVLQLNVSWVSFLNLTTVFGQTSSIVTGVVDVPPPAPSR